MLNELSLFNHKAPSPDSNVVAESKTVALASMAAEGKRRAFNAGSRFPQSSREIMWCRIELLKDAGKYKLNSCLPCRSRQLRAPPVSRLGKSVAELNPCVSCAFFSSPCCRFGR